MASFYGNLTLRCVSEPDVLSALSALGRTAFVYCAGEDVVVFDEASELDPGEALQLGGALSTRLGCVAFAVTVGEDDLAYSVHRNGDLIDLFHSDPDAGSPPSGGNARVLALLFDRDVEEQLFDPLDREMQYDGPARHRAMARPLGLPALSLELGFMRIHDEVLRSEPASVTRLTDADLDEAFGYEQ